MEYTDGELQEIWPELQAIAAPARERRRLDPAIFTDLVLALCARAPLSVRELSLLLERSEAYVGDAIRPLVAGGRIQFLYPDQPKHPRQKYLVASAASTTPAQPAQTPVATQPRTRSRKPGSSELSSDATSARAPSADAVRDLLREQTETAARKRSLERDAMAAERDAMESVPFGRDHQHGDAASPSKGWGSPGVSVVAAILIGIALAFSPLSRWPYYAAAAAVVFAIVHVRGGSRQYLLYQTQTSMRPSGPRAYDTVVFVLAKAAFSFVEIAIVVSIVSLIRRLTS